MKKILLATKNPGKILEYQAIFKEMNLLFDLLTLKDLNIIEDTEEDGKTFEENAIKKANFFSQFTNSPLLAEDSGLEIDCLNGEPGVYSRRWPTFAETSAGKLGSEKTDEELLQMLFEKMQGVIKKDRGAQFRVVLAFKFRKDSEPILAEGIIRGIIIEKPKGRMIPGFPYRSLFYVPELGKVLGEITMEEEAKIIHRRIAITKLLPELKKV